MPKLAPFFLSFSVQFAVFCYLLPGTNEDANVTEVVFCHIVEVLNVIFSFSLLKEWILRLPHKS